ncbi:13107_t:CDS:2, partial [Cetraspora pellucida]
MIDKLLDQLNNLRKKNNLKKLEWNTHLIFVAKKHAENISLMNEYDKNTNVKNFYYYDIQYFNKTTENEVFNALVNNKNYKKILLDKNYNHFGASFKNKHWVLIFGHLYAKENININLLLEYTNNERTKIEKKAIESWMESSGHKKQILDKDYIYFGAEFAKDIWTLRSGKLSCSTCRKQDIILYGFNKRTHISVGTHK